MPACRGSAERSAAIVIGAGGDCLPGVPLADEANETGGSVGRGLGSCTLFVPASPTVGGDVLDHPKRLSIRHYSHPYRINRQFQQGLPFLLNCLDRHVRYYRHDQGSDTPARESARWDRCAFSRWLWRVVLRRLAAAMSRRPEPIGDESGIRLGNQQAKPERIQMNRTRKWLLTWAAVLLWSTTALAQSEQTLIEPFHQPDLSLYGNPPEPAEGYFFSAEYLYWAVERPDVKQIGIPETVGIPDVAFGTWFATERSTADTSGFQTRLRSGARYEFGRVEDNHGWQVSAFTLNSHTQRLNCFNADVVFNDVVVQGVSPSIGLLHGFVDLNGDGFDDDLNGNGVFGRFLGPLPLSDDPERLLPQGFTPIDFGDTRRLPVVFDRLQAVLTNRMWGVEFMPLYRARPNHRGGYFDFLAGVRFLAFNEYYNVDADGGTLADSFWNTKAVNNMVGPQVGIRWFRQKGRLVLSSEARFLAAANFQSIRQKGEFASELLPTAPIGNGLRDPGVPAILTRTSFTNALTFTEFSPVTELRFQAHYKLTKAVTASVGWTGMYLAGLARPSHMVDYSLPSMGLLGHEHRTDMIVNGINVGVEWNR